MRDPHSQNGDTPEREGLPADGSRRAFVRRAALVGLPVVLATIPSRTVWAQPKRVLGAPTTTDGINAVSTAPSAAQSSASNLHSLFEPTA